METKANLTNLAPPKSTTSQIVGYIEETTGQIEIKVSSLVDSITGNVTGPGIEPERPFGLNDRLQAVLERLWRLDAKLREGSDAFSEPAPLVVPAPLNYDAHPVILGGIGQ